MLRVIGIFVGFFLVFLGVGYVAGHRHRAARAESTTLENVTLVIDRSAANAQLVFACNGKSQWVYDIQTKNPHAATVELTAPMSAEHKFKFEDYDDVVLELLGGASGGWSYKELMQALRESEGARGKWSIVAAVLGAITGFGVGYSWGQSVHCDSEEVKNLVNNPAQWSKIERSYFVLMLARIKQRKGKDALVVLNDSERIADDAHKPRFKTLWEQLNDAIGRAQGANYSFVPADFAVVQSVNEELGIAND